MTNHLAILLLSLLIVSAAATGLAIADDEQPYLVVLGIAQDGGVPQTGDTTHAAWRDASLRRLVVSLAIVDPRTDQRWLFEATPDLKEQLHRLDQVAPRSPALPAPGLAGIFLTHAHIGHYTGLVQLGHEALGAREVPVYVMPRFADFLTDSGPWNQLLRYKNISLRILADGKVVRLNSRLTVTPLLVPHRQEYSEVVGFRIDGPGCSVLFLPDIDSWDTWEEQGTRIEDLIADVDVAYIDATFYANGEIPGRDMSGFPHPFITTSMKRFAKLPATQRAKIRFIHLNHTNPALDPASKAHKTITKNGFHVAQELEQIPLGPNQ